MRFPALCSEHLEAPPRSLRVISRWLRRDWDRPVAFLIISSCIVISPLSPLMVCQSYWVLLGQEATTRKLLLCHPKLSSSSASSDSASFWKLPMNWRWEKPKECGVMGSTKEDILLPRQGHVSVTAWEDSLKLPRGSEAEASALTSHSPFYDTPLRAAIGLSDPLDKVKSILEWKCGHSSFSPTVNAFLLR